MFSRVVLRNSAALSNVVLRTAGPSIAAAPKMCLLHTSNQKSMPYKMPEHGGKVRLGFIPEEWLQMFYGKTGVTGPYMFGFGLVMYLINKEIYIFGPETVHATVAIGLLVYTIKKFGPSIAAYADRQREADLVQAYSSKNAELANLAEAIEGEKKEQWRLEGRSHLFDAKRENIQMQLELEYRERLQQVANSVKGRLDYQVDVESLRRRMEQQNMVQWIEENVLKSITPQQETAILDKCLTDLKGLAKA
ncbi:ATP synthase F(0) complex subunit B1, mitochondrial-like [Apostichopus japonicus]|uniref:ATP synthase F(0) complex subunit B1, mitochondrial-like n=1 Tax=Stichopus japonicus TaxID=307972 RepID=UPI003AB131F6